MDSSTCSYEQVIVNQKSACKANDFPRAIASVVIKLGNDTFYQPKCYMILMVLKSLKKTRPPGTFFCITCLIGVYFQYTLVAVEDYINRLTDHRWTVHPKSSDILYHKVT